MNPQRFHKLIIIILLIVAPGLVPSHLNADHSQRVLVLHSYHKGLTWTDSITRGIEDRFAEAGLAVDIEYAFMDTKRVFNQAYIDQLVAFYTEKFKNRRFDVIISSDDHAFDFLRRHHRALFSETPVVFCGVNYFEDNMLKELPLFTGVLESFDILTTLNAALSLQPDARRIVAISDQTITGKANKLLLKKIIPRLERKIEITILDNHTLGEVEQVVSRMSSRDIVVWLVFTTDRDGRFFSFEESTRLISAASSAPMYSFWDFNLGHGIVGGMLTSGHMQGKHAADLALRILHGEKVERLPVIKESPNQYMFDHRQLVRFNLKSSMLPAGSLVINRPVNFYSQNKRLFWMAATLFLAMLAVIISLLVAVHTRRRAEKALRASSDRFQNVFNSASIALLETDFSAVKTAIGRLAAASRPDFGQFLDRQPQEIYRLAELTRIKDINPAAVKLFQAPHKEALLRELPQIMAGIESEVLKIIFLALAEQKLQVNQETVSHTLKGQPVHFVLSLNFDHACENYESVIVSLFDITDRKKSEEALRLSEDRFRTVFNRAASGMALINPDGNYWQVNSALCYMLGYGQEELVNRAWKTIIHPDDMAGSLGLLNKVLEGRITNPIEKRYRHRQGHYIHVLFNLAAIFDMDGRPLYFIAQCQDITPIKEAQAALREREERYRQFFETDLSGVYVAEPRGKVILCNEVFAKILGFDSAQAVIGTQMLDYYKDPALRPKLLDRILRKERLEQVELEFIRRDGSVIHCLLNAAGRFDNQQRLIDIQGYLMDVTRMKRLEAQLLHAQKMESIGTMAGGVAHDFNNLLMGIVGNCSLMLHGKDQNHPDYNRLKNIEALVKSGSSLTRQLLGFAKGGKYEVRTTDLNHLIRRSIDMFARTHKEIEVVTDFMSDLSLVEVDSSQIDQVLYNLYLNAWQAMGTAGRLQIQTRNCRLEESTAAAHGLCPGRYVTIAVIDNGIGMNEVIQQRIFDPFFTTKERERGTGLGLASAYGIIQNHAGFITVLSKPRQGACFTIYLPASPKDKVDAIPEPSSRLTAGSGTILLVDDEPSVVEVVEGMLNHMGYKALTASDGQKAMEQFSRNHQSIDLVILDMIMPGTGGGELFDKFKAIAPQAKVLLCSGFSIDGQATQIIGRGCAGFIQKPFTIQQLSQKLNEIF
jgi:PAS domain S-box-containing protein